MTYKVVSVERGSNGWPTGVHIQLHSEDSKEAARETEMLKDSYAESLATGYFPSALGLPKVEENVKTMFRDE